MRSEYVIQWKSQVNGRAGRGSKRFARDDAERLVRELNEEYPEILHEVIPAPPELKETSEPTHGDLDQADASRAFSNNPNIVEEHLTYGR